MIVVVAAVCALSSSMAAHPVYVNDIPNGTVIDGFGCVNCHVSPQGGGTRNAFGSAMEIGDFSWGQVCPEDSDGDGQTNGEELGDPFCVWVGGAPPRTSAISNPGLASSTSSNPDFPPLPDAGPGACQTNAARNDAGVCECDDGFHADNDAGVCVLPDGGTGVCPPHSTATHDVEACRCDPGFEPDPNPTGLCVPIVVPPDAGVVAGDDGGAPIGVDAGARGVDVDGGVADGGTQLVGLASCASTSFAPAFAACAFLVALGLLRFVVRRR